MILLILAAIFFYRAGNERKVKHPWLWSVTAIAAYFAGPFLAGILIAIFSPSTVENDGQILAISIVSSMASLLIAYAALVYFAKKNTASPVTDADVIDAEDTAVRDEDLLT